MNQISRDLSNGSTSGALRAAIVVLVVYGVFSLAVGAAIQLRSGLGEWTDILRGLVRVLGLVIVIQALRRRKPWAWWTTIALSGLSIALGVGALIMLFTVTPQLERTVVRPTLFASVVGSLLLAAVVGCLLQPGTRTQFRARAD